MPASMCRRANASSRRRLLGIGSSRAHCRPGHNFASPRARPGTAARRAGRRSPAQGRDTLEDGIAEVVAAVQLQVHQQKGQVVQDVDAADLVAELDAVEQRRLAARRGRYWRAADRHDSGAPCLRRGVDRAVLRSSSSAVRARRLSVANRGTVQFGGHLGQFAVVVGDHAADRFAAAVLRRHLGSQMQARDGFTEGLHQLGREPPRLCHAIEQIRTARTGA